MSLKGTYRFFSGGKLVGEHDNIVTNMAKPVLLDFLSGNNESWAGSIGVGIEGGTALALDTRLGFETGRANVTVMEPRYTTGSIVCKATLPLNLITTIYEVGLFNSPVANRQDLDSLFISRFSPEFDEVTGVSPVEGRFGAESAQYTLGGASGSFNVNELGLRIDSLSSQDVFLFAYDSTGITGITINMIDEDGGERSYGFTPIAGFNVEGFTTNDFTGAGSFDKTIVSIRVDVTGAAADTLTVEGFRLHPKSLDFNETLMSHSVVATPIEKGAGEEMDIEFEITFGGLSG